MNGDHFLWFLLGGCFLFITGEGLPNLWTEVTASQDTKHGVSFPLLMFNYVVESFVLVTRSCTTLCALDFVCIANTD